MGLAKVIILPNGARPQESDLVILNENQRKPASPTSTYPVATLKASYLAMPA